MTGMKQRRRTQTPCARSSRDELRGRLCELAATLFLLTVCACTPCDTGAQTTSAGEYEVKAAMLYRLTYFVEWPNSAGGADESTKLCVIGQDPFGAALDSVISAQAQNGKKAEVRHLGKADGVRGCHVVYIATSEKKNVAQVLAAVKGSSVLTVGDMAQFAEKGGMIQFSLEDNRVRFDINLEEASQAGLKISSRLLMLARVVKNGEKGTSGVSAQANPGR